MGETASAPTQYSVHTGSLEPDSCFFLLTIIGPLSRQQIFIDMPIQQGVEETCRDIVS